MQAIEPQNGSRQASRPIRLTPGQDFLVRRIGTVPERAVPRVGHRVFFIDIECGDFCELGPCHQLYEADDSVIVVLQSDLRLRSVDGSSTSLEPGVWSISLAW
jgi:hypothetical protein